ncbi:MAG: flavodoxin family protein [Synergistaceae bacterium]|nr:flavodoxin family protein [Synergistaceae bacterium]
MKALFVNGSPRKNWNTHKMLESAMQGAKDSGAECEMIHLYDLSFKGCVSCFACKVKNSKTNGLCAYRDELRPVLEKALASDIIIAGSPIYFSHPTGMFYSFLERLMFPVLSYNGKYDPETHTMESRILTRDICSAMIYTMGYPDEDGIKDFGYLKMFAETQRFMQQLFGYSETLYAYNTYQFSDYSRYDVAEMIEPMKAKWRDEHFPDELKKAYELGKRLVIKAGESK